jgi:hypothetical protein
MDAAAGPAARASRGPAGWSAPGQGTAGRGTINSGTINNPTAGRGTAGRGTAGHSAGGGERPTVALPEQPLPEHLAERLAAFERHLAAERGLSAHTVRAYLGDIRSLLAHACEDGMTGLAGLDVGSTTVKAVVVDVRTEQIVWRDYQRHETRQPEKLLEFLRSMEFRQADIRRWHSRGG